MGFAILILLIYFLLITFKEKNVKCYICKLQNFQGANKKDEFKNAYNIYY